MNPMDHERPYTLFAGGTRHKRRDSDTAGLRPADAQPVDLSHGLEALQYREKRESDGLTFQGATRGTTVKVSRTRVLWRLVRLSSFAVLFCVEMFWRKLTRPDPVERQKLNASRFRQLIERLGGVLIKVGQQMSQRSDLVPQTYCDELRNLLDELPATIDTADVEAALRKQLQRPWADVFAEFIFDPVIGSGSIACVYAAFLHSGKKVAVKIRRPGIQGAFTADLAALEWVLRTAEFLTIWRPGIFESFRSELRELLLEELDFRIEARYQELFRRYHKRRKKLNVTAPKVYHELSGEEVMVSEFVTGHWVKDIIAAMDRGDDAYLADLQSLDIEPRTVAKHLIRSQHYSFYECPLFHGDPHAANIVIQPGNKIVMVDFGACGVFSERDRNLMWQLNYYYSREDVAGMVNIVISIMEPLDNRPITQFKRELIDAWWMGFYGIKSHHAEWWERTSVRLWLRFFELIKKHQIPVPRNMLRMIRATLSYDTVAARLYSQINVFKEFEKYSQSVARRARRQIEASVIRQLLLGPDDMAFLKLRQIATVGNGLLYRAQKFIDEPAFSFAEVAGKVYSAVRALVRMILLAVGAAFAAIIIGALYERQSDVLDPATWRGDNFLLSLAVAWFVVLMVLLFTYGRRVYLRFGDTD